MEEVGEGVKYEVRVERKEGMVKIGEVGGIDGT